MITNKQSKNSWIDTNYLRERVCRYTPEQLVDKSFKVKNWMDMNPENCWVQDAGNGIINKLNATYTMEGHI